MDHNRLKKLLSRKVNEVWASPNWFKTSFPEQTAFINDPAKLKAGHCTRRAGKSYGCGLYMCKTAYENPGSSVLYVGLTRKSGERIMWKDILKQINRDMNLNCKFYDQDLKMVFPNGSIIYIEGADAKEDAMDKFLGQKLILAIVDEASKFRIDVEKLIFDVLKPALADYEGTLAMIGTASNFVGSYFAKVTIGGNRESKGWAVHRWSAINNPHMKRQFTSEIKRLKEVNPTVEDEAWFKQNYLGKWVVDTKALIYKYTDDNIIKRVEPQKLTYNLGITLSYTGSSAFAVVGYSEQSRDAFIVETIEYEDNSIYRAIETIQQLNQAYDFSSYVCAEASDRLITELRTRFGLPVHKAPEKDKGGLIRLFTTELDQKHVKVLAENKSLLDEWDSIIIDTRLSSNRANQLREHPVCKNQLATATLYAWSKCYNYTFIPPVISDDSMDNYWKSLSDDLENNIVEDEANQFEEFY